MKHIFSFLIFAVVAGGALYPAIYLFASLMNLLPWIESYRMDARFLSFSGLIWLLTISTDWFNDFMEKICDGIA